MQPGGDQYTVFGQLPSAQYKLGYEECFYHSQEYLDSQPEKPRSSFFLCSPENNRILGKIHFHHQNDEAISQLHAPFGSFDTSKIPQKAAEQFLSFSQNTLFAQGVKSISIQHPADCYQPSPQWNDLLVRYGFSVRDIVNHHLVVDSSPLRDKMHIMEQRKLAKCRQFQFTIHPAGFLPEIYGFIESCRKERAQVLSLSYERLKKVVNNSPTNFLLCTVTSGNKLAAAAIIIKVNPICWYQFYPAHSQQFNRESPLVFLLSKLYDHARSHGVRVLDLGTSELDGKPINGLVGFKNRLGGKVTYRKHYFKQTSSSDIWKA